MHERTLTACRVVGRTERVERIQEKDESTVS